MIKNSKEGILDLTLDLVRVPSISTSAGELEMARVIYDKLSELEYFKNNQNSLKLLPIKGDALGRSLVFALVKATHRTNKTVILTGHYDVVGVEDFGALKELAFDPIKYTQQLRHVDLDDDAARDLESGNYLFARGIMDMKAGLAIQMVMLAEASQNPHALSVNLIFLAVPDEENNSTGMRGAIPYLVKYQEEMGFDYIAAINCEPSSPVAPGDSRRYVFLGTVGKIMPVFYVVGKESHVGNWFEGLNSNLLSSYINILLEVRSELSDVKGKEVLPPPVCLKQKDLRDAYSVTLPGKAVAYYNYLTVTKSPAKILEEMKKIAEQAFSMTVNHLKDSSKGFSKRSGRSVNISWNVKVITYKELFDCARQNFSGDLEEYIRKYLKTLPGELDERDRAIALIGELLKFYPDKAPKIVVGFLPPYYPHRGNLRQSLKEKNIMEVVNEIIDLAKIEFGEELETVEYFSGITDLSYFGFQGTRQELLSLSENMPGWGSLYDIPIDDLVKLDIPVLNIGPSGKDAHRYTERIELDYSFNVAPKLLKMAIEKLGQKYQEGG